MTVAIGSGRRTVQVSRPGKPLFPDGITKADLARYYEAVADALLPHIAGRPAALERALRVIDSAGSLDAALRARPSRARR